MNKLYLCLSLAIITISCVNKPQQLDPIPEHDNFTLNSTFVNETRVINVWLPPTYKNGTTDFPVIYMPDGGIKEDFPHIANTLSKLVGNKTIPPFILVGIENTDRRKDLSGVSVVKTDAEYCPLTDGAKNFRAFITKELMPKINTTYRTTNYKGIIGESLSGLFVMETLFLEPTAFNFYIAMDPSLWWNNNYLEQNASRYLANLPKQKTKLWFAGSDAKDIYKHTTNLTETLKKNTPKNLVWNYSPEPKEQHNTIFRATKEKALIWSLNTN